MSDRSESVVAGRQVGRRRLPLPAALLAWTAVAFFALPFAGLLWRAPWSSLFDVLGRDQVRTALWLSIRTSIAATILSVVFGVPLAWMLARARFRGRSRWGRIGRAADADDRHSEGKQRDPHSRPWRQQHHDPG